MGSALTVSAHSDKMHAREAGGETEHIITLRNAVGGRAKGERERELDGWARKRSRATERGRRIVWTLLEGRRRVRSNSIVIQSLLPFVLSNPP